MINLRQKTFKKLLKHCKNGAHRASHSLFLRVFSRVFCWLVNFEALGLTKAPLGDHVLLGLLKQIQAWRLEDASKRGGCVGVRRFGFWGCFWGVRLG